MNLDVQAVRLGLATAASSITGLRTSDFVPDAVNPPCFVVGDMRGKFHQTMGSTGGLSEIDFTVYVITSSAVDRTGQRSAFAYLKPNTGILNALEVDQTLGGVCSTTTVYDFDGPRELTFGTQSYWGVSFSVTVRG